MFIQWGFTKDGVEMIYASEKTKSVDFDREDVLTVYVNNKNED